MLVEGLCCRYHKKKTVGEIRWCSLHRWLRPARGWLKAEARWYCIWWLFLSICNTCTTTTATMYPVHAAYHPNVFFQHLYMLSSSGGPIFEWINVRAKYRQFQFVRYAKCKKRFLFMLHRALVCLSILRQILVCGQFDFLIREIIPISECALMARWKLSKLIESNCFQ